MPEEGDCCAALPREVRQFQSARAEALAARRKQAISAPREALEAGPTATQVIPELPGLQGWHRSDSDMSLEGSEHPGPSEPVTLAAAPAAKSPNVPHTAAGVVEVSQPPPEETTKRKRAEEASAQAPLPQRQKTQVAGAVLGWVIDLK